MKGTYILVINLAVSCKIRVGRLGVRNFNSGWYAYVGSALNSLEGRIGRHLRNNKTIFWHIDHLLQHGSIHDVYYKLGNEKEECKFARKLSNKFTDVKDFGASDCKCDSHLFYTDDLTGMIDTIIGFGFIMNNKVV
jgi:Uri superfamily endonuclease